MGNDMSTQALNRKIGDAVRDYVAFKALESKMETHKEFFKDLAEKQKQTDFVNSNGDKVKVSPHTTNVVDPAEFQKTLKSMKLDSHFIECVTVKVGDAKKLIGETMLEGITQTSVNPYGKVLFKPTKKGA